MLSYDELKSRSFSGRILFLNLNVRGRYALSRTQPPLGLMSLMGVCREMKIPYGYLDADAFDLSPDEVIGAIGSGKYAYVGVSLLSLKARQVYPLLDRIKKEGGVQLIVGGPLPTADPEWLLEECSAIDYAVLGEGEVVLPNLLLSLEEKKNPGDLPGIAFREGDRVFTVPRARECLPGEIIPMPDFRAIDYRYYSGASPVGAWPSANLLVTRGCPFRCTFCSNPIWNHKPYFIPVATVIAWLQFLSHSGIREVFFVDDTLNINPEWFEELCGGIMAAGLSQRMVFKSPFRANLTSPQQLKLARKAGFWLIFYGVESGDQSVLDYYRKGEKVEEMASAVAWTRAAGLKSQASMIAGAPIDTAETLLRTANFLREADPDYAPTHPLIPFLGTQIAEDIISSGILTPEEIRSYDPARPSVRTQTLSTPELLEIVDFMRNDFREFKRSGARRIRRSQELSAQRLSREYISDRLEEELRESQYLVPDGIPPILLFQREDPRIKVLGDELHCFTSDIRLAGDQWYDCEQGLFRWSRPAFECPFFLEELKDALEIRWAAMRNERVDVRLWINEGPPVQLSPSGTEWQSDRIPLPVGVQGIVWLKAVVSKAFRPEGDVRELGVAVQSIRFVKSAENTA